MNTITAAYTKNLTDPAPDDDDAAVPIATGRTVERHATCAGLINEYRPAA